MLLESDPIEPEPVLVDGRFFVDEEEPVPIEPEPVRPVSVELVPIVESDPIEPGPVDEDDPVPEPIDDELEPISEVEPVLDVFANAGTERAAATTVVNNNFFIRPPIDLFLSTSHASVTPTFNQGNTRSLNMRSPKDWSVNPEDIIAN